jgi:hypothetical protein
MATSGSLYKALLVPALLLACCRGQQGEKVGSGENARMTTTSPTSGNTTDVSTNRERRAREGLSEPVIDIKPFGTARNLTLRFRSRDLIPGGTSISIPLVKKILVGKPEKISHRGAPECLVKGEEPVSLKEWRYGDVPAGFEKFGCGELAAGHYVVSATSLGGSGAITIDVDEAGSVTAHPLDATSDPLWDGK